MKNIILLLALCFTTSAFSICSSPISRINNAANAILTSTKYNLDLNTSYTRLNELPGDCITANTIGTAHIIDENITTAKLADLSVTLAKLAAEVTSSLLVPPGVILSYSGATAPTGYLLGNGAAVSRTTYAALFAVTGEAHGQGDDVTTFNLVDCRGRFPRYMDSGAGRDTDAASRTAMATGGNTADNIGSVQTSANLTHTHAHGPQILTSVAGNANFSWATLTGLAGDGSNRWAGEIANDSPSTTAWSYPVSKSTGGDQSRPINFNVNCIVKY